MSNQQQDSNDLQSAASSNQNVQPTSKGEINSKDAFKQIGKNCVSKMLTPRFLLVAGVVIAGGLIVEGLLCFTMCDVNARSYVLSFYYIVFGLLSIGAELKFEIINNYLRVLFSHSGRGLWYIFLGTIALGSEWWAIFIAIFLLLLGLLNMMAGCQTGSAPKSEERTQESVASRAASQSVQPPVANQVNNESVNVEIVEPNSDAKPNGVHEAKPAADVDSKANPFSDLDY
eukprot:CAMPEP_0197038198 /NCGR_PEP_ID=MMETSP1384-20130603/15172_1 /TAXON_ID=29189 /ORGANISM="Ammonia sp." /LENGTH=229 /DNA_ID=CAMNT_0042468595 /DNA_START=39 /DNA_END=728 /DNA_ORIENTATION=+